ncbi:MAG: acyltransferase [Solirubrobacteraceae bacterium]|nr:acyltransferase [Solirubrobacteraceae bacterium]
MTSHPAPRGTPEGRSAARGAVSFFVWRAVGAALALGQVALVSALFGADVAARFFVLWTVVWCGSVWLRFGVDQLLPRHAVAASLTGDIHELGRLRGVLRRTVPVLAVALPVLVLVLVPDADAATVAVAAPLCLLGAAAWAVLVVLGALLRGFGHIGRSAVVQGVVPALLLLVAAGLARVGGRDVLVVLGASAAALWAAAGAGTVIARRALGDRAVRETLTGRGPIDRETVPAGMVTFLGEAGLALPVWLAALGDVSSENIAALYAALRVAALFSWAAGAVAAAVTPRLALAIARRAGVTRLLVRSAAAATLTTLPLVAVGLLAPDAILRLLAGHGADGSLLVILILGRAIDACTGPVSEALIVGRRARLELLNMVVFFVVVVVAGLLLVGGHGVQGLALAVALGTAACNVPRLIEVVALLRGPWGDGTLRVAPAGRRRATAPLVIATCAAVDLAATFGALDGVPGIGGLLVVVGTVALTFAVALREARRRAHGSWRFVVISPLAAAVAAWGLIFGLRPLELWLSPRDTTLALTALGFSPTDLVHAAAIGALGCAAWALGYLATLGRPPRPQPLAASPALALPAGPLLGLLALSCLLWGALFMRQGGLATLVENPGELHNDGQSGGYAILGIWLAQGVALYALLARLHGAGRSATRLCALATAVSVAAAMALQARGLLVLGVVAGLIIVLRARVPRPRTVAVAVVAAAIAVPALVFLQQVRSYSQQSSPAEAVRLALQTPPATQQISDLGVFDNLVALQQLVPDSAERLDGASLVAIPTAFVPRGLWPGKPQPVDQQMSALVYPGLTAGTPVALQGELWWNFGVAGVALGAVAMGLLMGLLARLAFTARSPLALLLYAVATASVVAPLTRALAPMTTNTALALAAIALVAGIADPRVAACSARVRRRVGAWVSEPAPATEPSARFRVRSLDGLRGLSALAIVLCHVAVFINAPHPTTLGQLPVVLGQPAVIVFFMVSAFVLFRPYVAARADGRAPQPSRVFALRRFARVVPAYWVILTAAALAGAAQGVFSGDWWRYYLLAQIYVDPASEIPIGGLPQTWSLAVEVTFYVLLLVLAASMTWWSRRGRAAARRWRARSEYCAIGVLALIGVTWETLGALGIGAPVTSVPTLPFTLHWFVVGMALAVVSVRVQRGAPLPRGLRAVRDHPGIAWLVAALMLVLISRMGLSPTAADPVIDAEPIMYSVYSLAGVVAAAALVAPAMLGADLRSLPQRFLQSRVMLWLGTVSYGLYLAHLPILMYLVDTPLHQGSTGQRLLVYGGVGVFLSLVVAAASWYLIERPAIRYVARRRGRRAPNAPLTPAPPVQSPA